MLYDYAYVRTRMGPYRQVRLPLVTIYFRQSTRIPRQTNSDLCEQMTELVHFHVHRATGGEKREEGGRQREGFHKKNSVRNGNKTSKEDGTDRRKVKRWEEKKMAEI